MTSGLFFTGIAFENKKSLINEKFFKKQEEEKSLNLMPLEDLLNPNSSQFNSNENKEKFTAMHKRSYSSLIDKRKNRVDEENLNSNAERSLVDFMIQDETKFADLDQIENYYKSEIDRNNKIFDVNKNKIEKRKGDLEFIELMIEKELMDNLDYDYDQIINKYEEEKNRIKVEMENKEHDLVSFVKLRNRIIGKKNELQKEFLEQVKNEENIRNQYEKYLIIKNKAEITVKNKQKLLREMRTLENMSSIKYEISIHKKKKLYNELNESLKLIKEESLEVFNQVENMKSDRKRKGILMKDHEDKSKKYTFEINSMIRENTKTKINLLKIMHSLKVESVSMIIKIYNKQKYSEESLYMQFQNLNKELNFLNAKINEYQKEIRDIEVYISEKQANTENTEPDADVCSTQFDCELGKLQNVNLILFDKVREKEDIVNLVCRNVLLNDQKLNKVLLTMHNIFLKRLGCLKNPKSNKKSQKELITVNTDEVAFGFFKAEKAKENLLNGFWNKNEPKTDSSHLRAKSNAHSIININELEKSYPKFFEYSNDVYNNKNSILMILRTLSILAFKIIHCAIHFLSKMTQENFNRKESRKDSNSLAINQQITPIIIPIISKDFTENMKTYINNIITNKNYVLITKPKSGKENNLIEKTNTRDNSSARFKKDLNIPEKFVNSTTVSAIYEKFLAEKLNNNGQNKSNMRNSPSRKGFKKISKYNSLNNTAVGVDFNRRIENKLIKNISKFTNELVSNDLDSLVQQKKSKARGHTSASFKLLNNSALSKNDLDMKRNGSLSRGSYLIKKSENSLRLNDANNIQDIINSEDSYISEEEKKNKPKIYRKKEINLFGADGKNKDIDKNKMYKRLGDLQNLELKYFKTKEKPEVVTFAKYKEKITNFKKAFFDDVKHKKMIKVNPNQLLNRDIFMKNVSNPNSSIILKEKYFAEANPQIEYLNELFNDNFLKENERLIVNYYENKRNLLKSSQMKKLVSNATNSVNNNNNNTSSINNNNNSSTTKFISGILENSNSNRKSVSSMLSKNKAEHRRNFSMSNLNNGLTYKLPNL